MAEPVAALLPDGRRLHLQHGPIDLIVSADGEPAAVARAYEAAARRFATVLDELVGELPRLKAEIGPRGGRFEGPVARRMARAVRPHWRCRVTPMAAVAGAVADDVLAAMTAAGALARASVNNGGDIAIHLAPGTRCTAGSPAGLIDIAAADPVRGLATSGRGGRSFSLGIADAVTVLAADAAAADAAATVIANAVDLPGSARVRRAPAASLKPDSDLGDRLVTVGLEPLDPAEIAAALDAGEAAARALCRRGLIVAAALLLAGDIRLVAPPAMAWQTPADAAAGRDVTIVTSLARLAGAQWRPSDRTAPETERTP